MSNNKKLEWTKNHQDRFQMLFNYLKQIENNLSIQNYITKINTRKMTTYINKSHCSNSTKEAFYFMLARYLKINHPENKDGEYYSQAGYNIKIKREEEEGENKMDEKEKQSIKPFEYFN